MTTNGMKLLRAFAAVGSLSLAACGPDKGALELQASNTMLQQKDKGMKVMGGHVAIAASDNFRGATQSVNAVLTSTSLEDCNVAKRRDAQTGKTVTVVSGCAAAFAPQ